MTWEAPPEWLTWGKLVSADLEISLNIPLKVNTADRPGLLLTQSIIRPCFEVSCGLLFGASSLVNFPFPMLLYSCSCHAFSFYLLYSGVSLASHLVCPGPVGAHQLTFLHSASPCFSSTTADRGMSTCT